MASRGARELHVGAAAQSGAVHERLQLVLGLLFGLHETTEADGARGGSLAAVAFEWAVVCSGSVTMN